MTKQSQRDIPACNQLMEGAHLQLLFINPTAPFRAQIGLCRCSPSCRMNNMTEASVICVLFYAADRFWMQLVDLQNILLVGNARQAHVQPFFQHPTTFAACMIFQDNPSVASQAHIVLRLGECNNSILKVTACMRLTALKVASPSPRLYLML